ncbi:hypothetical protein ACIPVK_11470 [Paeniglutamicibacter sp. MACA_103]|uniref:hypothetical protein n=1 Tax=Paeniglutamicibacter sp. MACA_103 TaxID=3377337 RepID=UPI0038963A05
MDVTQQRKGSKAGRSSFDWYAVVKGWTVTVGLWLGFGLALALYWDARSEHRLIYQLDSVDFWPMFAAASLVVALLAGFPLALLLDRVLRRWQLPWLHVAAFFAFFTLLPASLFIRDSMFWQPEAFLGCAALGACAGLGRAAAFLRGRAFRRPTTWA